MQRVNRRGRAGVLRAFSGLSGGYDAEWSKQVIKELKGKKPELLEKLTPEGIVMKPVYTAKDVASSSGEQGVSDELPGIYPFTRGPYASMYTAKPWTVRQVQLCVLLIKLSVRKHCRRLLGQMSSVFFSMVIFLIIFIFLYP